MKIENSARKMGGVPGDQKVLENTDVEELTPEQQILVEQRLLQVTFIAKSMLVHFPNYAFELNDFISWGTIGLIMATRSFNPQKSFKFATYAEKKIRGAILDGIRGMDTLKRKHREFLTQIERAEKKLRNILLRNPLEEEIAQELGLNLDSFRAKKTNFGEINNPIPLEEVILDKNDVNPETNLLKRERSIILDKMMGLLNEKEKLVIFLLFTEEMSQVEIAKILNVHETMVVYLKKRALEKLRKELKKLKFFSLKDLK